MVDRLGSGRTSARTCRARGRCHKRMPLSRVSARFKSEREFLFLVRKIQRRHAEWERRSTCLKPRLNEFFQNSIDSTHGVKSLAQKARCPRLDSWWIWRRLDDDHATDIDVRMGRPQESRKQASCWGQLARNMSQA